jgi:serine O-acetyltransferase
MEYAPYSYSQFKSDVMYDLCRKTKGGFLSRLKVFLFDFEFSVLYSYRLARWVNANRVRILYPYSSVVRYISFSNTNCHVSPLAEIGKISITHPIGIAIGGGVKIDDDVLIHQHVSIGRHGKVAGYPHIKQGAILYDSVKVFGGVTVGMNSIVGACAIVFDDIPDRAVAVGQPARIIRIRKDDE